MPRVQSVRRRPRTSRKPRAKPASTAENPRPRESTTSSLSHPVLIDFTDPSSIARGASGIRPNKVYRWSHEKNGTLASSVPRSKHNKHRDVPGLMLQDGNAFQSVGTLKPNLEFTKERFERHFKKLMIRKPTPFISTTSSLVQADENARTLHKKPRLPPTCLTITEIDTSMLVPATLKATMSTTSDTHDPERQDPISSETKDRDVEIPCWILDKVPYSGDPENRPSCEVDDILQAGGIFWFSVDELKLSDLSIWASPIHKDEWLAVGSIPKSIVNNFMPHDGAVPYTHKPTDFVRARGTPEPWYWNFKMAMWEHDPDLLSDPSSYKDMGDEEI